LIDNAPTLRKTETVAVARRNKMLNAAATNTMLPCDEPMPLRVIEIAQSEGVNDSKITASHSTFRLDRPVLSVRPISGCIDFGV
jgi:hypothetical protein